MTTQYHEGELAVQAQAGVQSEASRINRSIRSTIPPIAQEFLRNQVMVIVSSVDGGDRVWASLLTGDPGFLKALDEQTIEINAVPLPGDPLAENIHAGGALGLLAIDLATRHRMRVNASIVEYIQGRIVLRTQQVYANCHKYIQVRALHARDGQARSIEVKRTQQITEVQRQWIERADTFFVASYHPTGGADASHRGGLPGFVQLNRAGSRLTFPDYAGNRMFQTLGNLTSNHHVGLLFLDFDNGNTLQLSGRAEVIWDRERVAEFAGAERVVECRIDEVVEIVGASPLRGELVEYSPFLPD